MGQLIQPGRARETGGWRRRGFTLVEIMIVMAIIVTLIGVAVPYYQKSLIRAKESVLKSNLFTMRAMIDEYSFDKQKAPQSLQDLVSDGYLKEIPMDPMVGNNTSWKVVMEDPQQAVSQQEPGIWDVRSGSDKQGLDGSNYGDW